MTRQKDTMGLGNVMEMYASGRICESNECSVLGTAGRDVPIEERCVVAECVMRQTEAVDAETVKNTHVLGCTSETKKCSEKDAIVYLELIEVRGAKAGHVTRLKPSKDEHGGSNYVTKQVD